jgi:hypothetical protein
LGLIRSMDEGAGVRPHILYSQANLGLFHMHHSSCCDSPPSPISAVIDAAVGDGSRTIDYTAFVNPDGLSISTLQTPRWSD